MRGSEEGEGLAGFEEGGVGGHGLKGGAPGGREKGGRKGWSWVVVGEEGGERSSIHVDPAERRDFFFFFFFPFSHISTVPGDAEEGFRLCFLTD